MRIAIITGASSGLGAEFAGQLDKALGKTDEIWLLARRKEPMERLAEKMMHKTRTIAIDLTDEKSLRQFAEVLSIQKPRITVLVNCAGVGSHGAFAEQSAAEIDAMLQVNITALTRMTKLCLPYLRKGSKVIQLASGAAFFPQADFAVYAASKAYVYSFSRALGRELKDRGIQVCAVCSGPVDTPFISQAYQNGEKPGRLKALFMAKPERVVRQAIADCRRGRSVSICI
ncbi:MAG: SDR family NAD(P)-dependent oxidoreductase [Bacteroidales bacterium]|nr:SDR family NAD(P)-dependent oxidoreductase [Bacteroidales bacterium]MCM1415370.1 SDR family NAD(P)-dependent oxidoreductase [bacterium]MCM1423303.1 SDR family NAD(P)-dependent oxidoreductase [bacterium]